MKIYIASKTKHATKWKILAKKYNITSSWIYEAEEGQTQDYSELSSRCVTEIQNSDILFLYCESGEILKGALIEAGIALAYGIQVRCVGDNTNLSRVFKKHPCWKQFSTIEEALKS